MFKDLLEFTGGFLTVLLSLAVSGTILVCLVGGLIYVTGADFSPSAPYYQGQIKKCFENGGSAVLDQNGYLKECWVGSRHE